MSPLTVLQPDLLELAQRSERAGFRLHRFEVLNWGTFHRHVWGLNLGGDNGLLTGDIGSGKSTLVDGLVALLVAPQKLAFNKAAGAETRERSLRSYVLGQYKSERSDEAHSARPVALRDGKSYSVLLAHFVNEGYGQHVTLAQVMGSCSGANPSPSRTATRGSAGHACSSRSGSTQAGAGWGRCATAS